MTKNPVIPEVSSGQVGSSTLGEPVEVPTKISGPTPLGAPSDSSHPLSPPSEPSGNVDTAPDPFDPVSLRFDPGNSGVSVKKVITTVPCRKPGNQEYVRVRPGDNWRLDTLLVEDKETRDYYIVAPSLHQHLLQRGFPARLVLAVKRNNDPFLWLLRLPGADGRSLDWYDSALAAAKLAETKWVQVTANTGSGYYDVSEATGIITEPEWPDMEFKEILRLCFKNRFIDSLDHPFLRRLRGEV